MKLFGGIAIPRLALAFVVGVAVSTCPAQSTPHLDRHARKVHHKLAKYQSGRYLHLVLSNNSDAYGSLGTLSDASFTFTNADSNTTSTFSYSDVARVNTGKEPIGEGTEPRRHIRHLVPIVVTAVAVGAGAAVYEAVR